MPNPDFQKPKLPKKQRVFKDIPLQFTQTKFAETRVTRVRVASDGD